MRYYYSNIYYKNNYTSTHPFFNQHKIFKNVKNLKKFVRGDYDKIKILISTKKIVKKS